VTKRFLAGTNRCDTRGEIIANGSVSALLFTAESWQFLAETRRGVTKRGSVGRNAVGSSWGGRRATGDDRVGEKVSEARIGSGSSSIEGRPSALATVLIGGGIAGTLDGLSACVFYHIFSSVSSGSIFRYIASGLLGPSAFSGGPQTALLGLVLHYTIALGAAALFYAACLRVKALYEKPWIFGPLYGLVVFCVMHFVVVPLSRVQSRNASMPFIELVFQLLAHTIFIGSSIAFAAWLSARNARRA
jgi:hypothetical protein